MKKPKCPRFEDMIDFDRLGAALKEGKLGGQAVRAGVAKELSALNRARKGWGVSVWAMAEVAGIPQATLAAWLALTRIPTEARWAEVKAKLKEFMAR